MSWLRWLGPGLSLALIVSGCGDFAGTDLGTDPGADPGTDPGADPRTNPSEGPPTGNGDGTCTVPDEAREEDVSNPDTVVGDGTAQSCTADAFIDAVARGAVLGNGNENCPPTVNWSAALLVRKSSKLSL